MNIASVQGGGQDAAFGGVEGSSVMVGATVSERPAFSPIAPAGSRWPFLSLPFRWTGLLRPRRMPETLMRRLSAPLDDVLTVLFQQATSCMALVDRTGRVVRVNDALAAMARDGAQDLAPGMPIAGLFAPACRDEAWAELSAVLAGTQPPRPLVAAVPGPDGLELTVEVGATVLREADGAVGGLVLRLADITVQRRLEAQLVHGQKLQALGQLAGGIAHDFNNLLTAILAAADEQLARPALDAEAVEDMVQIRRSAERGASLVRNLLAFGRQQTLQPVVVSLADAVEGVSDLLRRLLGGRVSLALELEGPATRVRVDPTQLEQVLVNLAVNARDAMPAGGRLMVASGRVTLPHALTRGAEEVPPGRYAVLEVRDTGSGIPPEVLPRIFDPFFTTKRDGGGHGLGLSTVHGIVRQSGGFLEVDSAPGKGTSFRVYLPREDDDAPLAASPAPEAGPGPAGPGRGRCVLLVDDEEAVLDLGGRALAKRGWTVLTASSGEQALALAPADALLDIVVSDVVMPGMDGPALIRALRARHPDLPAILASGYAEESLRPDLPNDQVHFIAKPYTLKQLAALMDDVLRMENTA